MAKGRKTGGRKSGTPNHATKDIRQMAQGYGSDCIEVLYGLMINSKQDMVKLNAANSILDRGYGKPAPLEAPKEGQQEAMPVIVKVQVVDAS